MGEADILDLLVLLSYTQKAQNGDSNLYDHHFPAAFFSSARSYSTMIFTNSLYRTSGS